MITISSAFAFAFGFFLASLSHRWRFLRVGLSFIGRILALVLALALLLVYSPALVLVLVLVLVLFLALVLVLLLLARRQLSRSPPSLLPGRRRRGEGKCGSSNLLLTHS